MLRSGICAAFGALLLSAAPVLAHDSGKPTDWTGLYIGAHAGHAWGDWDGTLETTGGNVGYSNPNRSISADGWLGGLQAGYNSQFKGVVVGVEADISWSDSDGSGTFDTDQTGPAVFSKKHDLSLDYFGTARVRVGLPTGHFLPYLTGGVAWGKTDGDLAVAYYPNPANPPFGISGASTREHHVGWTLGGGVELALGGNWSLKAEYLHIDLGKEKYLFKGEVFNIAGPGVGAPFNTDSFASDLTLDTVRVGLNYKFGGRDEVVPLK